MIRCKNCGGVYDESLDRCPYCSTMNKAGSYAKFRRKVNDIIDSVLGLKEEVGRSVSHNILMALIRGFFIIAIIVGLAYLFSLSVNTNYYNDRKYDEDALKKIEWVNENIDELNRAYLDGDFAKVDELLYQRDSISYQWEYYSPYQMKRAFETVMTGKDYFPASALQDALYFLYYPDYFFYYDKLSAEDKQLYESYCAQVKEKYAGLGYTEKELKDIYEQCSDDGYLKTSDLEKYVKGGE